LYYNQQAVDFSRKAYVVLDVSYSKEFYSLIMLIFLNEKVISLTKYNSV